MSVHLLQSLGDVEEYLPELGLGELLVGLPELLDLGGQGSSLAELVLDVDSSLLDPRVVVADHVLVLHQGGVGEHLVHHHPLSVGRAVDLLLRHLQRDSS